MNRTVVYCGTKNIYHNLVVAAKSLLMYNDIDRVYFLIEHDTIDEPLPDVIKCINVSGQAFFPQSGPNYNSHWTYMTLMRLALHHILTEDRALYLDADTIVTGSIRDLFAEDISDYYFAAVREPFRCSVPFDYFNAGALYMNLEKLRDGMGDRLIDLVNTRKLSFPDQDAVNLLCQTKIKEISPIFNACHYTQMAMDARIVHFAAVRDYERQPIFKDYEAMDWREI